MLKKRSQVLFFAPHAGIWSHSVPEAVLAKNFKDAGLSVSYVQCDGVFGEYCSVMSSYGLGQEASPILKKLACHRCFKSSQFIAQEYGFESFRLSKFLSPADRLAIRKIVDETTRQNFLEVTYLGVPVGRRSCYELFLQYKKSDFELSDSEFSHLKLALEHSLRSLVAGAKIVDQQNPDFVVVYNSLYAVNAVIEEYCRLKEIPIYFIHGTLSLAERGQRLILGTAPYFKYFRALIQTWGRFENLPCHREELESVTAHFQNLLEAKSVFVYSAPKAQVTPDIRATYGILPEQKILVACLSSYDERFAAEISGTLAPLDQCLFKTQADWLRFLMGFMKKRPDLFLLIRVHPREFPNRRESVKSQHAKLLEKELRNLPSNVAVNWPEDQLSLYDLVEVTSVFLNAWSSVGREMCLFGRPVVLYSGALPFYPASLNFVGETESAYVEQINEALKSPFSFERIQRAYRWYVHEFRRSTVDLSSVVAAPVTPARTLPNRIKGRLTRYRIDISPVRMALPKKPGVTALLPVLEGFTQELPDTIVDLQRGARSTTEADERQFVAQEVGRLFGWLFPVPPSHKSKDSLYLHMKAFLEQGGVRR